MSRSFRSFRLGAAFARRMASAAMLIGTTLLLAGCRSERVDTPAPPPAPQSASGGGGGAANETPAADTDKATPDKAATEKAATGKPAEQGAKTDQKAPPFKSPLSDEELRDGWIALFDNETLFGWKAATKANWEVKDGVIEVSDGEPGLLCTTVQWSDYTLSLDFRFAPGTNSGIFLHSPLKPTDPKADCYELNIAEPAVSPFSTGSFVGRAKAEAEAAPDTWHHYDVTVTGGKLVVSLNGKQVLEFTDPEPLGRGHIGLQLNKGKVEFRNIKLKPLGLASLFNGKDLEGWKEYPDQKSKFTVTPDGELNVKGGRGQLETAGQFGDFVLQLECIAHAPQLNSGVFFRCLPGQEMQGYESQIHNGVKNGDRKQPVDCGTGGIFRRINARLVAADDLTWFSKTLVADGPHVSVWVNGYQVTDWTDERGPDENPRKGLRTAAGTLMLQGHDPTTDLSFRNLRAVELSKRKN